MAALVNALDNYTPKQIGENGHVEYGWSNNIREKILQLSFQLVRSPDKNQEKNLAKNLKEILSTLKDNTTSDKIAEKELAKGYLSILYRMIGHTRDIIDGKGEYTLTYMMIYTWFDFYPKLALFALRCLVTNDDSTIHQYGSWKDIKYFCEYCKNKGCHVFHPLIHYAIILMNTQLKKDYDNCKQEKDTISLVSKWVPREKSTFGWLYESMATSYFINYMETANTDERKKKAVLKCKMDYRKILSELNKKLDTLQIKQCAQIWSDINFNNVTSISMTKQKKAFLNVSKTGHPRFPDSQDRNDCAEHFTSHIKTAVTNGTEVKGARVGMVDFTKQALQLLNQQKLPNLQIEIDLLNSQWRDNSKQNGALGKMIAMVDVSGSMDGDPMHAAISLGIRIADNSLLGKRVMTFSSKPTWVNLEPYSNFVSQVEVIRRADWGMNTNFHAALDTILDAIVTSKMDPDDVQDLILVILSDMQMDVADRNGLSLYDSIKLKYEEAGLRSEHKKPYKPPHILFWNLRSTGGFPSLSTQQNASMMSGFSPVLLNLFCEKGLDSLQSCTPWSILEQTLENERYKIMSDKINEELDM
jgi:Mg-chelatase subunit ChlD